MIGDDATRTKDRPNRTDRLWKRPPEAPQVKLQPRDKEILRIVHRHRFARPSHVLALLAADYPLLSLRYLSRRMGKLFRARYLSRPEAQRPASIQTEEIVYALGPRGADVISVRAPDETGWRFIEHQLGVVEVMVALELASPWAGATLLWKGHQVRRDSVIDPPGRDRQRADAFFRLAATGYEPVGHFLEFDRGTRPLSNMAARYEGYFRWWKFRSPKKAVRVLTVTETAGRMESLRQAADGVGRYGRYHSTWKGLLFSHLEAFSLREPRSILRPIFRTADTEEEVSLLPREMVAEPTAEST